MIFSEMNAAAESLMLIYSGCLCFMTANNTLFSKANKCVNKFSNNINTSLASNNIGKHKCLDSYSNSLSYFK